MNSILVFCGANVGFHPVYSEFAKKLGQSLANNNITLVYGGGKVGLMGIVADASIKANGKVIGVIPEFLDQLEVSHNGLTQLIVVKSMHERKAKMESLADGIITMPGGYGSLDEMFEILSWAQLGLHQKPIGLLNINGFYNPLIEMLDKMVDEGFLKKENRDLLLIDDDIDSLLIQMKDFVPKFHPKWIQNHDLLK